MSIKLLIIGVLVFAVSAYVLTRIFGKASTGKSKRSLEGAQRQFYEANPEDSVLLEEEKIDRFGLAVAKVPLIGGMFRKLRLSGIRIPFAIFLALFITAVVVLGMAFGTLLNHIYWIGFALGFALIYIVVNTILGSRVAKRETYYLNNFPDAVDMIVRSVKSGQPLLSALKMIAQSATKPLADDFQRVIDEVAYGRPLPEALRIMADRVGFMDMNFFVVILSVQQETGGNLSEVLTNLAAIIRKRKQLRLKVRALTAQSKMTTLIFATIPFIELGAVYSMKPDYLKPFWTTDSGVYWLMAGVACIVTAIFLGRRVSNLEV